MLCSARRARYRPPPRCHHAPLALGRTPYTLYSTALAGTQRGSVPGAMAYMYPMGAGVSKQGIPNAPQGHHWSDAEHHFWCRRARRPEQRLTYREALGAR